MTSKAKSRLSVDEITKHHKYIFTKVLINDPRLEKNVFESSSVVIQHLEKWKHL